MAITHRIRAKNGGTRKVKLTRGTAILAFCQECIGWEKGSVKECDVHICPLWPFRNRGGTESVPPDCQK